MKKITSWLVVICTIFICSLCGMNRSALLPEEKKLGDSVGWFKLLSHGRYALICDHNNNVQLCDIKNDMKVVGDCIPNVRRIKMSADNNYAFVFHNNEKGQLYDAKKGLHPVGNSIEKVDDVIFSPHAMYVLIDYYKNGSSKKNVELYEIQPEMRLIDTILGKSYDHQFGIHDNYLGCILLKHEIDHRSYLHNVVYAIDRTNMKLMLTRYNQLSPNSDCLILTEDNTIQLHDIKNVVYADATSTTKPVSIENTDVDKIQFSHTKNYVVFCKTNGDCQLYAIKDATYSLIHTFASDNAFHFSPHDNYLLVRNTKSDNATLYRLSDEGIQISKHFDNNIQSLTFSPQERYLWMINGGLNRDSNVYEINNGDVSFVHRFQDAFRVEFSSNDNYMWVKDCTQDFFPITVYDLSGDMQLIAGPLNTDRFWYDGENILFSEDNQYVYYEHNRALYQKKLRLLNNAALKVINTD